MADSTTSTPKSYHTDPALYLYTSLTAGSSHIITATSRLETILKANKIPFQALDVATDEKARMLWGRRAGKRKLPGLVRFGMIVGDLEEVEEWNEYGELKENVQASAPKPISTPTPSATTTPSKPPTNPSASTSLKTSTSTADPETPTKAPSISVSTSSSATLAAETPPPRAPSSTTSDSPLTLAMRQAGFEAAKKAGDAKTKARTDALKAAKSKDGDLKKLDQGGPPGMPPPSGNTETVDAAEGITGESTVGTKADEAPYTEGEATEEARATEKGKEQIPSPKEVEESANKSILGDEEEVLEGKRQAELPSKEEVPSSQQADAAANEAIMQDKSHIVIMGHGRTPEGLTPEGPTPPNEKVEDVRPSEKNPQEVEDGGSGLKNTVSATDEAEDLPGKKTQVQPAAKGEEVESSVAD